MGKIGPVVERWANLPITYNASASGSVNPRERNLSAARQASK